MKETGTDHHFTVIPHPFTPFLRNCSARHPFDQLRTGLNPSLTVILNEAKNLPIAQGKLREESPPSGVETLHFIQGDIELECNYSYSYQMEFVIVAFARLSMSDCLPAFTPTMY